MEQIVTDMVGRTIDEYYPARTTIPGEEGVPRKNISPSREYLRIFPLICEKVKFWVVSGRTGAGRAEIMRAIFGVDPRMNPANCSGMAGKFTSISQKMPLTMVLAL